MLRDQRSGKNEVREIACARCQRDFGADAVVVLGEEHADVVAAQAEVAGVQQRSFCATERGEQEDEAGEMARSELHGDRWQGAFAVCELLL